MSHVSRYRQCPYFRFDGTLSMDDERHTHDRDDRQAAMGDSGGSGHGVRMVGTLSLAGVLAAATVLTGAALFTVNRAGCAAPGHYIRVGATQQLELAGGCIHASDLPTGAAHRATISAPNSPAYLEQSRP